MKRRLKHWCLPEFRCRTHQTHPSTLFSPIFSLAREKIGPPEARQKRPRRNEPPQATSLILCAHFFLSKPQTEFAVWVYPCRSAATSQSRLRRASIPTPLCPFGTFPPDRGNRPLGGEPWVENRPARRAGASFYCFSLVLSAKYSFVSFATTPERAKRAMKFGMAMRPLKVSAMSHTTSSEATAPTTTMMMNRT